MLFYSIFLCEPTGKRDTDPPHYIQANPALETSLANLKIDRERLVSQNEALRNVIISFATGLDKLARRHTSKASAPTSVTDLTVFPSSDVPWKEDALNARQALHELLLAAGAAMDARGTGPRNETGDKTATPVSEVESKRLEEELEAVKVELGE